MCIDISLKIGKEGSTIVVPNNFVSRFDTECRNEKSNP